jgi:predicted lipoprotein with Yx(FWY)xxD motif
MRTITAVVSSVVLLLVVSVSGFGQHMMGGVKVKKAAAGPILIDSKSMTLYTFDNDKVAGKSACNGPCAQNWPPLAAKGDAKPMGDWTIVTRDDGSKQWAYKGKPLYTYVKDSKAGDTSGDGFKDIWHVAKP